MNLLKKFTEDACGGATGAGAIAGFAMPLMTSVIKRDIPSAPKLITFNKKKKPRKAHDLKHGLGLKEACSQIFENDPLNPGESMNSTTSSPTFDASEITSKLKSLETKEKQDVRDTSTFGLEDDNGNLVRVTVKAEQAEEFENAIAGLLGSVDEDEMPEVAEVLFKLKDQFDIIDVVWPDIEEDEEEDQRLGGESPSTNPTDVPDMGAEEGNDLGGDLDIDADMEAPADTSGDAKDMLSQVIDMMKADAEARMADARAREAEAKNREAEAAVSQAHNRVKQEEELLDMDTFNKTKKEESKESKRLAQLAQWKAQMDSGDDSDSQEDFGLGQSIRGHQEEEERTISRTRPRPQPLQPAKKSIGAHRVHPHDVARYILNRIK